MIFQEVHIRVEVNGATPTGVQERIGVSAHPQIGHQVFEKTSRPGDQHAFVFALCLAAAEIEPACLWDVALGNGNKGGKARFGGQQIVAGTFEAVRTLGVADREEFPLAVVEKTKIHVVSELFAGFGKPLHYSMQAARSLQPSRHPAQ